MDFIEALGKLFMNLSLLWFFSSIFPQLRFFDLIRWTFEKMAKKKYLWARDYDIHYVLDYCEDFSDLQYLSYSDKISNQPGAKLNPCILLQ